MPRDQTQEDVEFARDTRDTAETLLRAYGTGELQYARAVGTTFRGLDNAASLNDVTAWRVRNDDSADSAGGAAETGDDDAPVRVGDVTVIWELSGGAGTLRCTYRLELRNDSADNTTDNGRSGERWYLASIGVPTEAVT
ncbi:hypothetical protein BU204_35790 [Actinophytocola xanthii]|uniref:SnoaL-like domain-containing protein n=1 Tax=Actinophytocola xanthii TaxID=1912961 RepID=A0A1Q8BY88_9PSEU|nr:hypothetical protein BU204_35790 [Actinophytocola xanthii]